MLPALTVPPLPHFCLSVFGHGFEGFRIAGDTADDADGFALAALGGAPNAHDTVTGTAGRGLMATAAIEALVANRAGAALLGGVDQPAVRGVVGFHDSFQWVAVGRVFNHDRFLPIGRCQPA